MAISTSRSLHHRIRVHVPYGAVADEYYDAERHPTCRNFRDASLRYLATELPGIERVHRCVDIGAGKSVLAELLSKHQPELSGVFLVDQSLEMLSHSQNFMKAGAVGIVADASALPLESNSVDIFVASLGDPYNTDAFWSEIRRCLTPNGRCLYTTPSFEWASQFRARDRHEKENLAYFELVHGGTLYVPSVILSTSEQTHLIARHGLATASVRSVSARELPKPISHKLRRTDGRYLEAITGYEVRKKQPR